MSNRIAATATLVSLIALTISLSSSPAKAILITHAGGSGSPGAAGTPGPDAAGGPGSDGGAAMALAGHPTPNGDRSNEAVAGGGAGGNGGNGAPAFLGHAAGAGGTGGVGGQAEAAAGTYAATGNAAVRSVAVGGSGGHAGLAGAGGGGPGDGGSGGAASVLSVLGPAVTGGAASAEAIGGAGGRAGRSSDGTRLGAGGRGGLAAARVESRASGNIEADVTSYGGLGGAGPGGAGGHGVAESFITNAHDVDLLMDAFGGAGRHNTAFGIADGHGGDAGAANSRSEYQASGRVDALIRAKGGAGGGAEIGDGGAGGEARAIGTGSAGEHSTVADAQGGRGGVSVGTGKGGRGGDALAAISAEGRGHVEASATGGEGGGGSVAGRGGDAAADARIISHAGAASADANAHAGAGGASNLTGLRAAHGNALAQSEAHTADGTRAQATAFAADGFENAVRTIAGTALTNSQVTDARLEMRAVGERRGAVGDDTSIMNFADARRFAPTVRTIATEGYANYGYVVAKPTRIVTSSAAEIIAASVEGTLLGAGAFGGENLVAGSARFAYSTGAFDAGDLWFGLIEYEADFRREANFSLSLMLEVAGSGLDYRDQWLFTDLAAIDAFFADNLLDLGYLVDGPLTVAIGFEFISKSGGDEFGFTYAFGVRPGDPPPAEVPEPASLALMLAALALCRLAEARPMRRSNAANRGARRSAA